MLECDPAVRVALKGESRLRDRLSEHLAAHGVDGVTCLRLTLNAEGKVVVTTRGTNAESVGSVPLSVR